MKKAIAVIITLVIILGNLEIAYSAENNKLKQVNVGLSNFDVRNTSLVKPSQIQKKAIVNLKSKFSDLNLEVNQAVPHLVFRQTGYLTSPSKADPLKIAYGFLSNQKDLFGLNESLFDTLKTTSIYQDQNKKASHIILEQNYQGISVFGSSIKLALDNRGQVLMAGGEYLKNFNLSIVPSVPAENALKTAEQNAAPDNTADLNVISKKTDTVKSTLFDKGPFLGVHGANLTIFNDNQRPRLAWQILFNKNGNEHYLYLIDARTSQILYRANIVKFAQGLVFEKNPDAGNQVVKSFDATSTSPTGFVTGSYTYGNNVYAQVDWNANNIGNNSYRSYSASQNFTSYPFQNSWALTYGWDYWDDANAAVINLFYFNNFSHDFYYGLGFTEAAGNFQNSNFANGGSGSDPVQADAQDFSGMNNANFATPPDGYNSSNHPEWGDPRMQMYLFDNPRYADGAFDGDVMIHEYTHGVSNRLVGGASNASALDGWQSGAMGEAWGDFFGGSVFNDPVVGAYATGNNTTGIRSYAMNNNPLTYGDFGYSGGPEVHADGEIFSGALWDLRTNLINRYGYDTGKHVAEQLVIDGMKLSISRPTFLNMRDAILLADRNDYGGANLNLIWKTFARRGMGLSASSSSDTDIHPHQAFDYPKPITRAPRRSVVKRNHRTWIYYKIAHNWSSKAKVVIKFKKGKKFVKTLRLGWKNTNQTNKTRFKARLAGGRYRFYIYAIDQSGNPQKNVASNILTVIN